MAVYGIALWYNTPSEVGSIATLYDLLARNGYGLVEIDIDYPWFRRGTERFTEMAGEARARGIEIGIHAPWRDIHLASPYEAIRKASVETVIDTIDHVAPHRPPYMVIHVSTVQKLELPGVLDDAVEAGQRSIGELLDYIEEHGYGILLGVENLSSGVSGNPETLLRIVEPFRGKVSLCLDIGHLATWFNRFIRRGYDGAFLDYLREYIARVARHRVEIMHLHDVASRGNREHLVIGEGDLDYKSILKTLRSLKPSYVVMETFRDRSRNMVAPDKAIEAMTGVMAWVRVYL